MTAEFDAYRAEQRADADWLANLKPGDAVIVSQSYGPDRRATISRMTATQYLVGSTRYAKRDGHTIGQSYTRGHIRRPTPERLERLDREALIRQVRELVSATQWNTRTGAQLLAVREALTGAGA